jgi:hypothetical protein
MTSKDPTSKIALIAGATGAVGKEIVSLPYLPDFLFRILIDFRIQLKLVFFFFGNLVERNLLKKLSSLIESSEFTSIHSFGRSAPSVSSSKLQHHELDFSTLSTSPSIQKEIGSLDADSVFIALGTTLADAGSSEKFVEIDKDYVIEFAKAAKSSKDQQVLYCSVSDKKKL